MARKFRNIQDNYCNRNANTLVDAVAKKVNCTTNGLIIVIMNDFSVGSKKKKKKRLVDRCFSSGIVDFYTHISHSKIFKLKPLLPQLCFFFFK